MNYNIRADIKPRRILNAGFKTVRGLEAELGITFSDGGSASPPYLGEYTVTPTAREQLTAAGSTRKPTFHSQTKK